MIEDKIFGKVFQKRAFAELLFKCPSIQEKGSRESLLQELPAHIAGAIKSCDIPKTHVLNIVTACANYEDGLKHLLDALRFFDGNTKSFKALIAFLERAGIPYAQSERGDVTHISGISSKEYQALSKELGVRQIALENFFEILDKGAVPLKELDKELREVAEKHKEFLSGDFRQVMEQSKLNPQIQAKYEFTRHGKQARELIKKARRKLRYLPSHPDYLKVMLMGGTVLSSAGELREAKKLLHQALEISETKEDSGLIRFNLFQINIRCRDYRKALDNLQEAIKINPGRYALHDVKKYPIERLLGAGGMGAVFLCSYPLKKKKVAVKCLWEKREEADKEALIMKEVAGKYVPGIIDYDYSDSERAYFVTEYVEGAIDGAAWLKKHGKLCLADGLEVGRQIAEALQSAHEKGIFHLDLKPANILLKRTGSGIAVKVIDFGLSKVANSLQEEAASRHTQFGLSEFGQGIMGTLEYAPPEQLGYGAEYGEPDDKSDVFSFGTTLYHLLTGESPRFPNPRKLPDLRELHDLLFDCVELIPQNRLAIGEAALRLGKLVKKREKLKRQPSKRAAPMKKPAWADKLAQDRYGVFADFSIRGVVQRMRRINPGRFMMGSPESEAKRSNDERQHEVTLSRGFWLADTVCTQALWQAVMGKNPSHFQGEKKPVEQVTWKKVSAFILQLNEKKTGLELRLPTEAEWEYACRAGTDTPFWFGDNITPEQVNYHGNPYAGGKKGLYRKKTVPVKDLPCNAWGLYQMHGNVWEWCQDWYSNYSQDTVNDPAGPDSGTDRVQRGGSWLYDGHSTRSANRGRGMLGNRDSQIGFRLARGQ